MGDSTGLVVFQSWGSGKRYLQYSFSPHAGDQASTLWTAVGGVLVFLMVPAIGFLEAGLVRRRYAMGRIQVLELANANVCLRNYFQLTAGGSCT